MGISVDAYVDTRQLWKRLLWYGHINAGLEHIYKGTRPLGNQN